MRVVRPAWAGSFGRAVARGSAGRQPSSARARMPGHEAKKPSPALSGCGLARPPTYPGASYSCGPAQDSHLLHDRSLMAGKTLARRRSAIGRRTAQERGRAVDRGVRSPSADRQVAAGRPSLASVPGAALVGLLTSERASPAFSSSQGETARRRQWPRKNRARRVPRLQRRGRPGFAPAFPVRRPPKARTADHQRDC